MVFRLLLLVALIPSIWIKVAHAQSNFDPTAISQSIVNSQADIAEIKPIKDAILTSINTVIDEMTNKVRVAALRGLGSQRAAVVSLSNRLELSTDVLRDQKTALQNKSAELQGEHDRLLQTNLSFSATPQEEIKILKEYRAKFDTARTRAAPTSAPTSAPAPTVGAESSGNITKLFNAINTDSRVRLAFPEEMIQDYDLDEIIAAIDDVIAEIEAEIIEKISIEKENEEETLAVKLSLSEVLKQISQADSHRNELTSILSQLDTYGTTLLQAKLDSSDYTSKATYVFGGLVAVVIIGFFGVAFTTPAVRTAMFSDDRGIQFITLFSLVIAIILFGILGILEGKELSALLGGLSGYILGRGSNKSNEVSGEKPAAALKPELGPSAVGQSQ